MIGSTVPLAILPGGTANVLAEEMGLGNKLGPAVGAIASATPHSIAAGLLNASGCEPHYFLLMAGVGLDAHIVYRINLKLKAKFGKLAYWFSGFSQLGRKLETFGVLVNGHQVDAGFTLVSRVRNYGGDLSIARGAHLLRPDFEVVVFEGSNSFRFAKYLYGVVFGGLSNMKGVTVAQAPKIRFDAPAGSPVYVQVDGEYAGRLPATVEIVPNALTLLLPGPYRALHG
jgi:diacylglycerol kinase (ATP)